MFLYVDMRDDWGAFNDHQFGSKYTTSRSRIVRIKLTEEQIRVLTPRQTGSDSHKLKYEDINPICIQEK